MEISGELRRRMLKTNPAQSGGKFLPSCEWPTFNLYGRSG